MTASIPLPALPEPQRLRWQPLRMGLVELYHYDCEEFWFRDGHVLLRGNNGTGKSKVLSLALPFLLDLNLSAARVEPDGDRTKRMEWNLLMGRYERRTGYTWIEFGRRDENGGMHYLTLGCGLSAVAGRPRVETWPFVTELRIGEDLWLVTPDRAVLTRDRLADKLAARGQIFDTAMEYRRAVDERLFRLGEERYRALIDTLIQLRQPQLSRRPNEDTLSDALTEALPPLPQATLEDVAEAMTQLESYRRELSELETLRRDIAQFSRHYATYASVRARREARVLRQAQTDFDMASRALNEARTAFEAACAAVEAAHADIETLQRALARDRAAMRELERDPAMRDAQRLREAVTQADDLKRETETSGAQQAGKIAHAERERAASARCREESQAALTRLSDAARGTAASAAAVGLETMQGRVSSALGVHERLVERTREDLEKLALDVRESIRQRREQLAHIRRLLDASAQSAAVRDQAAAVRNTLLGQFEAAQRQAVEADAAVRAHADEHVQLWRAYLDRLNVIALADADTAMDALAVWVDTLSGDHPLGAALARGHREALAALAHEQATAEHRRNTLEGEVAVLEAERQNLEAGAHPRPPALHTRETDTRVGRPGAPLWQLLEFHDHVAQDERAGIEAALEAAGLIDAWVTPEGIALDPGTHDVVLAPRTAVATALGQWLRPAADDLAVSTSRIEALLSSIACGTADPVAVEAWVSPDGRFRLGPAGGAWRKPVAQYIGYAAREAARRERLAAIEAALAALQSELVALDAVLRAIDERRERVNAAYAAAPSDSALRDAHARFAGAEARRREAHAQFVEADVRAHDAEQAWMRTEATLRHDAEDLRLPADAPALSAFDTALSRHADITRDFMAAALDARRALEAGSLQEKRERDAQDEAEYWKAEHARRVLAAEVATARRDTLQETVGAAVQEIERRLAEKGDAVRHGEERLEETRRRHNAAVESRGASQQKSADAQQMLDERVARRYDATARLQGFGQSGLLAVALVDLETPDIAAPWTIDPALQLARRIEQALVEVPAEDADWTRIQSTVSSDFNQLVQAMAAQGHQAQSETSDFGLIVHVVYLNRPERPDVLERRLDSEIGARREVLTAREREVLENHLQAEVAASLQKLLQESERRVRTINAELEHRPTSTGVRFRLDWQVLPEGEDGAPVGLTAARGRLLHRSPDAWSQEDRRLIGQFLQQRIGIERSRDESVGLVDHLTRALDYRRWHRFRIRRLQEGEWRPLSGPASSGERALGLTVPLFAAASSHYASADYPHAPRLVLLDEAYAGIDDEARAHCMGLIREFDLDFVMTSEREWGCYEELPGLAICQLVRREGVDAVFVSRWSWDGRARREELDPSRRFPERATAS